MFSDIVNDSKDRSYSLTDSHGPLLTNVPMLLLPKAAPPTLKESYMQDSGVQSINEMDTYRIEHILKTAELWNHGHQTAPTGGHGRYRRPTVE